eukprot:2946013-Rhodomonas_salina.1
MLPHRVHFSPQRVPPPYTPTSTARSAVLTFPVLLPRYPRECLPCPVGWGIVGGMVRRASYALSGTDIQHLHTCLRAPYAMSGTDIPYGPIDLPASFAIFGTEKAYAATPYATV